MRIPRSVRGDVGAWQFGLLGELRLLEESAPPMDLVEDLINRHAGTVFCRGSDYYFFRTAEQLGDHARALRQRLSRMPCRPELCQALPRFVVADRLLNSAVRLLHAELRTFGGPKHCSAELTELINAAVPIIIDFLIADGHSIVTAVASPALRDIEAVGRPRTHIEGDNPALALGLAAAVLDSQPQAVCGPLLGAGTLVPLVAALASARWSYALVSHYDDAHLGSLLFPRLDPKEFSKLAVVDDNVGTGRTIGTVVDLTSLDYQLVAAAAAEMHWLKAWRREKSVPEGLNALTSVSPWVYRHYRYTDVLRRHYSRRPDAGPTLRAWARHSGAILGALLPRLPADEVIDELRVEDLKVAWSAPAAQHSRCVASAP